MLLDVLQLPTVCHVQQKIPKKSMATHAKNSAAAARLLQDSVESILLLGHITPNNSNIAAFADAQHEYLEILHIRLELKDQPVSTNQLKALHQIFHQGIAYPLLLEVAGPDGAQWSLAEKTINQANPEHEQLVIQELLVTDWQTTTGSPLQQAFWQAMRFAGQNHSNLMTLYRGWINACVRYLTATSLQQTTLGDAAACYAADPLIAQQQLDHLRQIQDLQQQINALRNQRDACRQFNDKVVLNLQLQKLNQRLKELAEKPDT